MATQKIILMACGSFSPPTPMHLRMFEIARDYFIESGTHHVIGGIISPVHDSYGKNDLAQAKHRCAMVKLGLKTSNWIRLSDWECNYQDKWTPTRQSLQYHQNYVNSYLNDINGSLNEMIPGWIPDNIKQYQGHIQLKLVCGADLLESFSVPGLWKEEDIEAILEQHGLIVITRSGSNPEKFIFESDLLSKYKKNITLVTNWIANEVSSTIIRRFLRRGVSVKYLIDDSIIDYIKKHKLYGITTKEHNSKYLLSPIQNNIELTLTEMNYLYHNDIEKLNLTNNMYKDMDTTDSSRGIEDEKTPDNDEEDQDHNIDGDKVLQYNQDEISFRPKIFCCGRENLTIKSLLPRSTTQTINVLTHQSTKSNSLHGSGDPNNSRDDPGNDIIHEVGEYTKLNRNTLTLTPPKAKKSLEKKIEFLSDNHLNRIGIDDDYNDLGSLTTFNKFADVEKPTTSTRSQNDLIKFVFTSHGIRVISDKEYVV